MFDSIGDLPLHPLVIHAVVMMIPATLGLSVLFAYPRTRAWARWALPLVAVGAVGATLVAKESGQALYTAVGISPERGPVFDLINSHARLADQLIVLVIVTAVLAVACALLVSPRPGAKAAATKSAGRQRAFDIALPLALVVVAAFASFWAYRVGDLGAQSVWNPAGTLSYSVEGE